MPLIGPPFHPGLLNPNIVDSEDAVVLSSVTASYDDGAGQTGSTTVERVDWDVAYWNPDPENDCKYFPQDKFCAVRWMHGGAGADSESFLVGGGFPGTTGTTFFPWFLFPLPSRPDDSRVEGPNPKLIAHAFEWWAGAAAIYPNISGDTGTDQGLYGSYGGQLCIAIETNGPGGQSFICVLGAFGDGAGGEYGFNVNWWQVGPWPAIGDPFPHLVVPIRPLSLRKRVRPRAHPLSYTESPNPDPLILTNCWAANGSRLVHCDDTTGLNVGMEVGVGVTFPQVAAVLSGTSFLLSAPCNYIPVMEEDSISIGCGRGDITPGSGDNDLDIGGVLLDSLGNPSPVTVTVS